MTSHSATSNRRFIPLARLVLGCAALVSLGATPLQASSPADHHGDSAEELPGEEAEEVPIDESKRRTFELGEFVIKSFRPVEQEQLVIRLIVHAEVTPEQKARFTALWPSYQQRVRSQIITAVRVVSPQEFDDPQLRALRRRIFLRLRRVLPDLPIEQIYVSDFSYLVE
jgi:hypothetical protein